jgi:hypothetical protein
MILPEKVHGSSIGRRRVSRRQRNVGGSLAATGWGGGIRDLLAAGISHWNGDHDHYRTFDTARESEGGQWWHVPSMQCV